MAIHQQQRHLRSNHPLWKRHVLLGCWAQAQKASKSTEIMRTKKNVWNGETCKTNEIIQSSSKGFSRIFCTEIFIKHSKLHPYQNKDNNKHLKTHYFRGCSLVLVCNPHPPIHTNVIPDCGAMAELHITN